MVACEESGDRVLPNEVRGCELTGKIVRRDRLKRSEASGRMILETEMESSAFSGRLAEPDRMVVCGVSGDRVLADEVFQCPVSGRTARRDLFQKSDVTGQMVLKSELSRSAESGRHAEPEHMAVCEVSGDPILRDELIVCDLTGKAVRPSLVAASDVSGRVVLASELQASAESSSRGLPDEMVACAWDGQLRVPADTGRCRLTHLIVGKQYLCGDRSLAPLLDLADDPGIGHPFTSADLRGRKSPVMRKLQKLKDPSALATPDARGVLIVGERPGFLGLGRHTAFYLLVEEEVLAEGRLPR
jgi:hypothetical protein